MSPSYLPRRDEKGFKGTFGTVLVVGGHASPASVMLGAPALAARAALRVGCGRCIIGAPATILPQILALCPSATGVPIAADDDGLVAGFAETIADEVHGTHAAVIGPGFDFGDVERDVVLRLIARLSCPIVLDADGLNVLNNAAAIKTLARHGRAILTPHLGEFRRLTTAAGIGSTDGPAGAAALAKATNSIVVLKGATTIIASPDGTTTQAGEPNSVMAVGGSGDVLAGAIAGLIAQEPDATDQRRFEIITAAVTAHATAGRNWRKTTGASGGMLATELADELIGAVESLRRNA